MATLLKEANFNGSNGNHFKLRLEYSYTQSGNKTTITYDNYFVSMDGYSGSGAADGVTGYINSSKIGTTDRIGVNQKKLLGSKVVEVPHNNDGTFPNTNYSASIQTGWSLGEANVSGTLTSSNIPKINRASTWTTSPIISGTIGSTFTLPISKWVDEYHNVVTISNLQNTKTIRTINDAKNGDSVTFTSGELDQVYTIDNNSRTNTQRVYLNLYTYDSNNNQIGDVQRTYLEGQITNANPTSTNSTEEQNASVISLLGSATSGKVIKFASELEITCLPEAKKGASITNLTINGNNVPYHSGKNMYDKILTTTSGWQNQNIRFICDIEPGETYTFNVTNDRTYCTAYLYDSNGSLIRTLGGVMSSHSQTFTAASNEVKGYFDFYSGVDNVNVVGYDYTGVQLEKGATATTYEDFYRIYETTLSNLQTGTFNIIVTDTRGNTANYTISKTLLDYVLVNIPVTWTIQRVSPISANLVLNAEIDCYSSTIDGNTNTPLVQYSTDNSTWTTIPSTDYTFSSNKITITNLTLNNLIPYQTPGKFYLSVSDLLTKAEVNRDVPKGIYTFAKGETKVIVNGDMLIRDADGNNEINPLKGYSTTGEVMIGFLDSTTPIYRRVITGTKVSGTNLQISASWVSDIDRLMRFDGTLKSLSNYNYPLSRYESSSIYVNLNMNRVEGWIMVNSSSGNYSNGDVTIIVEYTKT